MRKRACFILLVFLLLPITCTHAATRIFIDKPASQSLFSPQVSVEGRIINPPDNYIRIKIEHFIERKGYKATDYIVPLINNRFKKPLNLPPGISIITVSTLDNEYSASMPILFFSGEKGLREEEWDKETPISFSVPEGITTSQQSCLFKGNISDPALKNIEIMVINLTEFQRLTIDNKGLNLLKYEKVQVKNSEFSFRAFLNDGINLIIARPEGKNSAKSIRTKTIIYEASSPNIFVLEPKIEKENLIIEGTAKEPAARTALVRTEALIKKEGDPLPVFKVISEKEIPLNSDGKFNTSLSLKEIDGIFDKTYFLVSIINGKDKTVRLIIR